MDEIHLKLESKEDVLNIITALIKTQTMTMVKNDSLIDLTARVINQASEIMTVEELRDIQSL